jgi:hypothetical protein
MRILVLTLIVLLAIPCSSVNSHWMPNLDNWYAAYNAVYFGDRLPKNTILRYDASESNCGETFKAPDGTFRIVISPSCNVTQAEVILTLTHEMVHVDQWDINHDLGGHGPLFEYEMEKLALMGAFKDVW